MSAWVRSWRINLVWRAGLEGPCPASVGADTPAQLRDRLDWARRNPDVVKMTYESMRRLEGDKPNICPTGHELDGGSATRARVDWRECPCGGHMLYVCPRCGGVVPDPPVAVDCRPTRPAGGR